MAYPDTQFPEKIINLGIIRLAAERSFIPVYPSIDDHDIKAKNTREFLAAAAAKIAYPQAPHPYMTLAFFHAANARQERDSLGDSYMFDLGKDDALAYIKIAASLAPEDHDIQEFLAVAQRAAQVKQALPPSLI